jgi:hypothetical protein
MARSGNVQAPVSLGRPPPCCDAHAFRCLQVCLCRHVLWSVYLHVRMTDWQQFTASRPPFYRWLFYVGQSNDTSVWGVHRGH